MTRRADPLWRFVGAGMMAVGGLAAALCGCCTVYFIGASGWSLVTGTDEGYGPFVLIMSVVLGIIPTLALAAISWWGLKLYRNQGDGGAKADD